MNTPHPHTPPPAPPDDSRLRQRLRETLAHTPADGLEALESRALAQWRMRTAQGQCLRAGPLAALQAGWRHHPLAWSGTLLALGLAAVLLLKPWAPPDPTLDELMQPDLLSLIAIGEL